MRSRSWRRLVRYLPLDQYYKFIFMDRDLEEILRSQETMLDTSGRGDSKSNPSSLRSIYPKLLNQAQAIVAANPNAEMMTVAHRDVLHKPAVVASRVAAFLGLPGLDMTAMASVVDAGLYRARGSGSNVSPGLPS